jgi:hypothetical protein
MDEPWLGEDLPSERSKSRGDAAGEAVRQHFANAVDSGDVVRSVAEAAESQDLVPELDLSAFAPHPNAPPPSRDSDSSLSGWLVPEALRHYATRKESSKQSKGLSGNDRAITGELFGARFRVGKPESNADTDADKPSVKTRTENVAESISELLTPESYDQHTSLAQLEEVAFAQQTFQAFADRFVEVVAAAHGLGIVYQVAKWAYGVAKWLQVSEGQGGAGIQIPYPLGADVLVATVNLDGDSDSPLFTLSVAPPGESGAGALLISGLEVDPAVTRADRSEAEVKHHGPVEAIPWESPTSLPESTPSVEAVAAARSLAENDLLLDDLLFMMRRRRRRLREAKIDLVIRYDLTAGLVVWVELCDVDGPRTWSITEDIPEEL